MKKFTLIELIVVIAVLGILAAIIVPNISSFQRDAREVQLTADLRNIQTASDMFRVKSASGVEDPTMVAPIKITATDSLNTTTGLAADLTTDEVYNLVDMTDLYSKYLRKVPTYVKNGVIAPTDTTAALLKTKIDWNKGEVVAGILEEGGKSTAIVRYISVVSNGTTDQITVVRQ